jgi:type I restriction enzyme M protein
MLDSDTKRRINTCRDILVGKVPDPKSQVEQITIALIYKFMDDMDLESEEMGGARKFFTGEYERYAWAKLVAPGVGGQEMLNLYSEALIKMVGNEKLPALFRDIFRNAYLPYRDPETLRSFLREINGFSYDHSERLGDAFEYLLSVLGSQGDAGQFRTPRHIIDFMVEIIDPKKEEVILDPACGTAGFLISSYKHILKANSTEAEAANGNAAEVDAAEAALESPLRFSGDLLTPEDRQLLAANIKGYDISPDMVRLSLVNLYLHGFADPKVEEYDTLTSDDKWNEMADVILANPPFMSPKGGIKPHNRFGVPSKRSEVLFVDYIAEHLNPNGRAAIVVPEGIIFQSQSAYCDLRKILVEKYLAAVVSLPAGVFNPYSGVKTSILILDRAVAKASDSVAFFKVENDGFGLGAQRRAVKGGQLGQVKAELGAWLAALRGGGDAVLDSSLGYAVEKARIAEGGEYNLSGERYRVGETRQSEFPMHDFDQVCTLEYGASLPKSARRDGPYPVMGSNGVTGYHNEFIVAGPSIIVGRKGSAGEVTWIDDNCFPIDTTYYVKQRDPETSDLRYLYWVIRSLDLPSLRGGAGIPGLNRKDVYEKHQIPLPPREVQREIVAEIEGYQKEIEALKAEIAARDSAIASAIAKVWGATPEENAT